MSGGVDLGINGIAPYQTFDGVMELKMVRSFVLPSVSGNSTSATFFVCLVFVRTMVRANLHVTCYRLY